MGSIGQFSNRQTGLHSDSMAPTNRLRGIAVAPSGYEAGFLSGAHRNEDVDLYVNAAREALAEAWGR